MTNNKKRNDSELLMERHFSVGEPGPNHNTMKRISNLNYVHHFPHWEKVLMISGEKVQNAEMFAHCHPYFEHLWKYDLWLMDLFLSLNTEVSSDRNIAMAKRTKKKHRIEARLHKYWIWRTRLVVDPELGVTCRVGEDQRET